LAVGHKNEYRIRLAKKLGADRVIKSSADDPVEIILQETEGRGVDQALEFSGGEDALKQALKVIKPAGHIQILGFYAKPVTIDIDTLTTKGASIHGIHGRRMFEDWYRMQGLFKSGINLMPVLTHKFPLDDIADAMELMRSGDCGKVALYPE
jgi:threonine 3-dehydrogenase